MKTLILAILMALAPLSHADTGYVYMPGKNLSYITYQVYVITGNWLAPQKQYNITTRTAAGVQTITQLNQTAPSLGTAILYTSAYQPGTAYNPNATYGGLYDAVGKWGTINYFGEIGAPLNGLVVSPAEPKLVINTVGGERLSLNHQVADSTSGTTIYYPFHSEFWTIGHYAKWGAFTDCWRTTLIEYRPKGDGGTPGSMYQYLDTTVGLYVQQVYQYVYSNGVGLVDNWYGIPDANGNLGWLDPQGHPTSYEFYALSWGQN